MPTISLLWALVFSIHVIVRGAVAARFMDASRVQNKKALF
jgi:hypothetical protein